MIEHSIARNIPPMPINGVYPMHDPRNGVIYATPPDERGVYVASGSHITLHECTVTYTPRRPQTCDEFFQDIRAAAAVDNAQVIELLKPPYALDISGQTFSCPVVVLCAGVPCDVDAKFIRAPAFALICWRGEFTPTWGAFVTDRIPSVEAKFRAIEKDSRRKPWVWRHFPRTMTKIGFSHVSTIGFTLNLSDCVLGPDWRDQ